MNRKIIHLDMDAFYASIEERDNPELVGKPVIVGSPPNQRGVVSTCNYLARTYGVHSAMSSSEAYRRCPHAVFVTPHFAKYQEASLQVHAIMEQYTDCIEFLSLDEGYMDVTGSERFFGSAERIARTIQEQVYQTVKTTCSVGVGYNMLSAKLASEEKKPQGFFVIPNPETFFALMQNRPVETLYGIGAKTKEKLRRMGIVTVKDLADTPLVRLHGFGVLGEELLNYAHGIDHRAVTPNATAKSIGKEITFLQDVDSEELLTDTLLLLSRTVSDLLKKKGLYCRTVTLKLKFPNMQSITRSVSGTCTNRADEIFHTAERLLATHRNGRAIRLIGVTTSNLTDRNYEQLSFDDSPKQEDKLDSIVTKLRNDFGKDKIKTAKELLAEQHLTDTYHKH